MENPINDGDWHVGVLFSQTGVTAAIERSQLNATLLAIEEINKAGGVLGRPIEPVIYDPASNPTLYEGFEYSPYCIYTGATPNQNSFQLANFLLQNYGNRFVLVGSNYIYPYESNRVMTDFIAQAKGKVLDEIY